MFSQLRYKCKWCYRTKGKVTLITEEHYELKFNNRNYIFAILSHYENITFIQEFVHVLASTTKYKGDPNHWLDEDDFSGLITYLFGKDRKNVVTKDQFFKLRNDLLEDIFWLEFTQYSKDGKTMSDEDFCNHLFLTAKFSAKKKNNMVLICNIIYENENKHMSVGIQLIFSFSSV